MTGVNTQDVSAATLTSFHVSMYTYDQIVLDMARDYVKGHLEDYYFCQYDDDEYILILSDDLQSPENTDCSAADCQVIVFWRNDSVATSSSSVSMSGTITEAGASPSVDSVSLSGSVSDTVVSSVYQALPLTVNSLHIYNSEWVVYSSVSPVTGKLVEGVNYYAFAGFCLALGIIAFNLIDRIFKRVY